MDLARAANLVLKFGLELAAVVAFAYWGASVGNGAVSVAVALAAPLLAIGAWGRLAAPRARRRLPTNKRIPFELGIFGLAALALLAAGATLAAALFAAAAIVNAASLTAFHQWEA
jgi:hypothetical protein